MTTTATTYFIFGALAFTVAFVWVAKRAQRSKKRWVRELFGGGARRRVSENHYAKLREHALNVLPFMVDAGTPSSSALVMICSSAPAARMRTDGTNVPVRS